MKHESETLKGGANSGLRNKVMVLSDESILRFVNPAPLRRPRAQRESRCKDVCGCCGRKELVADWDPFMRSVC